MFQRNPAECYGVRDFNMRSRDISGRRQPRAMCQGRNQLRATVAVSYTHLDVYKRQALR